VREEWLNIQDAIAERVFCPQFLELWRATETPFLQPIIDLAVARMVQGRVLLLGDAALIPRPHTAASTAKAGANALALGRALQEFPDEDNENRNLPVHSTDNAMTRNYPGGLKTVRASGTAQARRPDPPG
jgi:2-polyprenyl-6-methoxyphenol hydroxylase-like FAD-dependent oxidoreductase